MAVGGDAFAVGESGLKANEVLNVVWVVRDFDGEVFARELVVAEASAVREAEGEVSLRRGKIEKPSVGGVNVFGFDESHTS